MQQSPSSKELSATRRALPGSWTSAGVLGPTCLDLRSESESALQAAELALEGRGQLKSGVSVSISASLRGTQCEAKTRPTSLGSLGSLGSGSLEVPEISFLKDGVRAALEMMSSIEERQGQRPHEFRACSGHPLSGQWTRMPIEDSLDRFKIAPPC